ncbi:MAG: PAS domain S-box protein, partial [Rhizobacter sp.]
MSATASTVETLRAENAELRARLEEAEEMLRAIRAGEVDALVVEGDAGPQLFTLQGLDAEQNRLRSEMLAQVSDAVVAVDLEERITFLNAAAERQYGVRASDVLGRKLAEISTRHWPSPEQKAAAWAALREHGEWHGEYLQRTHDGRELHVDATLTALRDAQGETIGHLTAIRDITERKQAERQLLDNERRFRAIFNSTFQFIGLLDTDGRLLESNQTSLDAVGITAAPVGAFFWETPWWAHYPADRERVRDGVHRAAAGEFVRFEAKYRPKDGSEATVDFSITPIRDESGKVVLLVPEGRDITECKQAEEALRLSEEQLRLALEGARLGMWTSDVASGALTCNALTKHHFGLAEDATLLTNEQCLAFVHPDDRARVMAVWSESRVTGKPYQIAYRVEWPDGSLHWLETRGRVFFDAGGTPIRTLGVTTDISDRKQAEEALRESETRYRGILRQSPAGIVQTDATGCMTLVNERWCEMLGYSEAELLGRSVVDVTHPSSVEQTKQNVARLAAGGPDFQIEKNYGRKDGSHFPAQSNVSAVRSPTGEFLGLVAVVVDMTERLRAEEELKIAVRRNEIAQEAAGALLYEFNPQTDEVKRNDSFTSVLGYAVDEIPLTGTTWQTLIHPDDLQRAGEVIGAGIASGDGFTVEYRVRRKDGHYIWIYDRARVFQEAPDGVRCVLGMCIDITKRRETEERLRDRAGQLDLLARSARRLFECHTLTPEIRQEIFGGIAELIGVGSFFHYRADNSERSLYLEASGGLSDEDCRVYGTLKFGELLCGRVAESGQRLIVEDLRQSTQPGSEPLRAAGVQSYAGFPLLDSRGELVGTLAFISSERTHFREGDVQMIETICAQVASMMERKWAAEALRESEEFNRSLMDGSADCVKVLDVDGHLLHMNAPGRCLMEIDDFGPLCGQEWSALWPAEARQDIGRSIAAARHGESCSFQAFCPTAKGTPRWWDVVVSPVRDWANGQVVRLLSVSHDVTERKNAEEQLRVSEESFRGFFENLAVGTAQLDAAGRFFRVNDRYCAITGYCREELLGGMGPLDLDHPEDREADREGIAQFLRGEISVYEAEKRYVRKDGEVVWVHVSVRAVRDADGVIRYTAAVIDDITERKRAEEALREKEHFLQRITQVTPGVLSVFDLVERRSVFINRSVESVLGYSPEEVQTMGTEVVPTLMHPDDLPRFEQHMARVRALADGEVADFEHQMRDRAGEWRWFHSRDAVFERDAEGAVCQLIGAAIEITESKQAEERLREHAEILSQVSDTVGMIDSDERILFLNSAGEQLYRVKAADVLGRNLSALYRRRWLKPEDEAVAMATLHEHGEALWELIHVTHDGRELFVQSSVSLMRDATGKVTGIIAAIRDITERKRAEEAVARLAAIVESSHDALFGEDLDGIITSWNPGAEKIFGYRAEEIVGTSILRLMPADRQAAEHELQRQIVAGELGGTFEAIRLTKEGREFPASITIAPLKDTTGKVIGTSRVLRDITERTRAEDALRASEQRRDLGMRVAGLALAEVDYVTGLNHLSEDSARHFGLGETAVAVPRERVHETFHPDDRAVLMPRISESLDPAGEGWFAMDHRIVWPSGEVRWLRVRKQVLFDGEANARRPVRAMLATLDITDEKLAEERLRLFENVITNMRDVVMITEAEPIDEPGPRIVYVNPAFTAMTGYTAEEAIGKSPRFLQGPKSCRAELDKIRAALEKWQPVTVEVTDYRKDGTEFDVEFSIAPVANEKGWFTHWVSLQRDVSERKRAENAVRENAALFSSLIAQAPMGTYVVDAQFRMRQVNAEAMPTFASAQPLIGRDFQEVMEILWGPEVGGQIAGIFRHTLATGERYISPPFTEQRHDLGIEQTYEWETQRVTLPDGQHGVVCYFHEVTERARAAEALRASQKRMSLAAEATGVGIWEWNVITNAIRWDAEMFRIYGIEPTPDGFVHYQDWSGAVLSEDLAENEAILQDTVRRCGQSTREFRIRRLSDGECRWIQAVETVRANHEGKAEWVVGTNLDVTERQVTAQALRDTDRRKDEFLATLAHELRNPLAPMRTAVELLRMKGPDIPELQWARDVIDRQTQAMTRLIDDLMDVSRINQGKVKLKREQVELARIIQGAVETSHPLIEEMGHELTVTLPPRTVIVDADLTRLAQVILNLLNNAAKYTERGGRIDLRAELQGSDVVVSVTDTGIGIPADKLPTLFEMFSQVEGALSRSQGGLGIGLSLVKRLVEMHGGSVEARSGGPGKGSEFLVRLPIVVEQTNPSHSSDDGDKNKPTSGLRILVVDDNRDAAQTLAMLLKLMGNSVHTAHDGEEAVAAAGEYRPHVVLCDIGMPKLNGYEACRQMKAHAWDEKIILIAMTGWGQDDDRRKSAEAGFDHHLVKPVDPQALLKLLTEL